ncbi:MAG: hypothetical protein IPI83_11725 [Sphingomonadales bacterium]|nr:hypothetical protein [Sphingomonadales bacterium]
MLGAFPDRKPEGQRALESAYRDVLAAFDAFMANRNSTRQSSSPPRTARIDAPCAPVEGLIAASRSPAESSLLMSLLARPRDRRPTCVGRRRANGPTGRVASCHGEAYAEPAGYADTMDLFEAIPGLAANRDGAIATCAPTFDGRGERFGFGQCVSWHAEEFSGLQRGRNYPGRSTGARCDAKGFSRPVPGPTFGPYVLPEQQYHVV